MFFELNFRSASEKVKFAYKSNIVKFFFEGKDLSGKVDEFESVIEMKINKLLKDNILKEDEYTLRLVKPEGYPDVIHIYKTKKTGKFNNDYFRNTLAGLLPQLEKKQIKYLHVIVPGFSDFTDQFESEEYYYQTFVEGIFLGNYKFDKYKSDKKNPVKLNIVMHSANPKLMKHAIGKAAKLMYAVYFARDLVNEPAITLTPSELAARTKEELSAVGVKVSVFNEKELQKRKMNAILAVGGASSNPPRLITIKYKPKKKAKGKIALVGKGVTYDTGGLSIKPTEGMLEMKADMAGSATVIGIIKAAAELQLPVELIGIIPAVENAISGNAYKPGDIVSTASGKTIEVKNTDAEGRIVLADALEYASSFKPDEIIDFATLTGAIAVALGLFTAGFFTKNNSIAEKLKLSSKKTYEHIWQMPFWDEYKKLLESKIADISNLGPRWGGAITAAKFLEHFVDENRPWVHIDLAGPAIQHEFTNYTKDSNTGFGIRLITDYLMRY